MSRLPLRLRVAGAFALAMAAVLAGTSVFLYLRLGDHLTVALDQDLRLRAQDLRALVEQRGASLGASGGGLVESGESYAEVLDLRGRVLDATRPLQRQPLPTPAELAQARRGTLFADRQRVPGLDEPSRFLATPVTRDGGPAVLVVGATLQDRAETLSSFRDELVIAGPVALVLATLAGYLLAGLALRPVESMRRRAAAISAEQPGERLPVPRTRDELERLGETLNAMLGRLEEALQRERDFVADAGHELRTPLGVLRTEIELALRQARSAEELREALAGAAEAADHVSQLAESLLLIARSDRGDLPLRLEHVDVDALFAATASRFEWRTGAGDLVVEPTGAALLGDRIRLEQALSNLVDNALRHGRVPVRLAAEQGDGQVELHVRDAGEGFPRPFLAHAFERFTRSDASRGGDGAGLGLAIVQAIAEAHGGEARAVNTATADGGADVWLSLPVDPQRPG